MPNMFDALLDPEEDFSSPEQRAATAALLRKQNAYGALGQIMGIEPTMRAGGALQDQAQGSLKLAIAKQQELREQKQRAEERAADEMWKRMNYDAVRHDRAVQAEDRDLTRETTAATREQTAADRAAAAQERADKIKFDQGTQLRGEYDKKLSAMQGGVSNAQTLLTLAASPDVLDNPQAQTAMVFAFGKALDANSTVREGEYKLFEESRGMLDSWGMTPERIATGARLSPQQIKQMVDVANIVVREVAPRREALDQYYHDLATKNQLDPTQYGLPTPKAKAVPPGAAAGPGTAANPIKVTRQKPAATAAPAPTGGAIEVDY